MSDDELRASDAALEARTRGDLERVTVDLPAAHTAPLHRTRTRLVLALFGPAFLDLGAATLESDDATITVTAPVRVEVDAGGSAGHAVRTILPAPQAVATLAPMEGGGFNLFGGGDPEEFLRAMQEAMERAGEQQAEVQTKHFAQETLDTAVELTSAALGQIEAQGSVDEQAIALRDAMRVLFPEAVALVSAARQGLMRDA